MKSEGSQLVLSASDLVGHLNCGHLTELDLKVATGVLDKPEHRDPFLELLRERGDRHEKSYIDFLERSGFEVARIDGNYVTPEAVVATQSAMAAGAQVIVQAAFAQEQWSGRADILRRVETPSLLGSWSYEIIDTKLARDTKAGSVLQLCLYADLLDQSQGVPPEYIYVVAPWSDFEAQRFRYADYAAYFRKAKAAAETAVSLPEQEELYPDPKSHCDICRWSNRCDSRRRADDHLCLVAGISKNQIAELQENGIPTMAGLATMPTPMSWKPKRGAPLSYEKASDQARIQIASREAGTIQYEFLPVVEGTGLCILPEPSDGDIFFDIESDAFVGEHGLEYLFGYLYKDEEGSWSYKADWALSREGEKSIFERFVDFVEARREQYPDLHIYHYAPYESGALKRLMGRYASRENQIDDFLRQSVLVDLYSVVRNSMRVGVESYSIKRLEPVYSFERRTSLPDANLALSHLQAGLELDDILSISDDVCDTVQSYNYDDCASTLALRDWLESCRTKLIEEGEEVPRPQNSNQEPSETATVRQEAVRRLIERLTTDVPADLEERTGAQHAKWILAYILEWHRREDKATWWEYFRLSKLTSDELIDERSALAALEFVADVTPESAKTPIHRYQFPQQDTDLRGEENLEMSGGGKIGSLVSISTDNRTVGIKKKQATASIHPEAVFAHQIFRTHEQADSLMRLGEFVAEHGIEGDGQYYSGRMLLLRQMTHSGDGSIRQEGETALDTALRIARELETGVFPIQGPPGTGKSHTGARMICELVGRGKKVGITANSHKVIRNLLDMVVEAAEEMGVDVNCVQKPKSGATEQDQPCLQFLRSNDGVYDALGSGSAQVAGATHFLWSREDASEVLDVLVIDEAAQMSLANVLAVSQSARALILIGDPQQLDQPTQGTHPDGTGVSALEHILGEAHTIAEDRGLFLEQTWRLHPRICQFNSELFYDGKLQSLPGCDGQKILSDGPLTGAGLRFLPTEHSGNQSSSIEESEAVANLVTQVLSGDPKWIDRDGQERALTLDDMLIITPYNAQVFEIQQRLPDARVGTVDKFQGQEAPIVIYSMATSSYAEAPRGMEFLYSANRFNVAVSRAKCLAVLVASPSIFEADCRTPRQMQLANAFCRYLEVSESIGSKTNPM